MLPDGASPHAAIPELELEELLLELEDDELLELEDEEELFELDEDDELLELEDDEELLELEEELLDELEEGPPLQLPAAGLLPERLTESILGRPPLLVATRLSKLFPSCRFTLTLSELAQVAQLPVPAKVMLP